MSQDQRIKELIDQLDDFEMNLTARYQLAGMGAAVLPALLKALAEDPREMVRQWIVDVLAKMKAQEAVPALLKALKEDEFEGVRSTAAGALAVIGGNPEEIVPALAKALEDESDRVTRTADMWLRKIAEQLGYSSIEDLIKAF
ncbi:MAG: HEAT repeat domain-containing protein [Promethearchaeota archaeon]